MTHLSHTAKKKVKSFFSHFYHCCAFWKGDFPACLCRSVRFACTWMLKEEWVYAYLIVSIKISLWVFVKALPCWFFQNSWENFSLKLTLYERLHGSTAMWSEDDWIMHWFVSAGKQVFVKRNLHSTTKSFLAVTFKSFFSRKISNKANIWIYFAFQRTDCRVKAEVEWKPTFLT